MAELTLALSGRIEASLDVVWRHLTDHVSLSAWLDLVDEVRLDTGRVGFRVGRRWVGGVVEALEAPRRVAVRLDDPSMLLRSAVIAVDLLAAERGTAFRVEVRAAVRPLAAALSPWLRLRAQVDLHRAVRGLRAWIDDRRTAERHGTRPHAAAARPWDAIASTSSPAAS